MKKNNKKYKLANEQNIYNNAYTLNRIKRIAVPVILAGFTVFASAILFASDYKWNIEEVLYEKTKYSNSFNIDLIQKQYFIYGNSDDVGKINKYLNNTSLGDCIYKYSELYGVDAHIMTSIFNSEGILNDDLSEQVIEHKINKFSYNMQIIYELLNSKYPNISAERLNGIVLLCSIQSDKNGLNSIIQLINKYEVYDMNNDFDYNLFKEMINYLNNGEGNFIEDVFSGVSNPDLKFYISGERINYSLDHKIDCLGVKKSKGLYE